MLGQSRNDGWHARLDGHDLGAPTLDRRLRQRVADHAAAGQTTLDLHLTWTPQRLVWAGLGASAAAVLACLVLLVVDRRRPPDGAAPMDVAPPADRPRRRLPAVVAVVGAGVGFALVGGPVAGLAAAGAAVLARSGPGGCGGGCRCSRAP